MAAFFKKALGIFLEFDEDPNAETNENPQSTVNKNTTSNNNASNKPVMNQTDIDKFEKHFEKLFDQANLPGPDYFEFWKMMETLEAHIADEKARLSAVYASLTIQGMTKNKLVESASQYKEIIEKDKLQFHSALNEKAKAELESRKGLVSDLEKKIVAHSEMIQKLTKEITEAQAKIGTLNSEIVQEEAKLQSVSGGYGLACDAMLSKISKDIQKIQTNL
jgi:chromosome segregation ATPase